MAQANEIEDIYPLAPLQHGLLFHALEAPGSGVYVQQLSCELHGRFDPEIFRRAWQGVMDRHTALRTAFVWQGLEEPLQVVYRRLDVPFLHEDWRSRSPAGQEESLTAFLAADLARGFTPSEAPLLRLALFRRAEQVHQLVWTFHHLLLDGWSVLPVIQEVFAFYEAFAAGRDPWIERPRPFRDYIEWLQLQDRGAAEEFWRRALAGFRSATPLALSEPGRAGEGHRQQVLRLDFQATTELRAFASVHQLTVNTVVQGLWALLLSHYSGEPDVVFGTVTSGRPESLPGAERMVGLFINTLPMRVQVAGDTPVADWLHGLQEQLLEARQYEYIPLLDVRRQSEVPGGQPLFESLLTFENYPVEESLQETRSVLDVRNSQFREQTSYPLGLLAAPGREMDLTVVYDPARFSPVAVTRLLGHCQTLLAAIVAAPDRRLGDLLLLTPAERHQVLSAWNDTALAWPERGACLHELIAAQAAVTPQAVAVVCEEGSLTYRELDERAGRLAGFLRSLGVGPAAPVGVCAERSLELVVALLGVLKAGAAYLPLDPEYPRERLVFMLEDSGTPLVLTQERLSGVLQGLPVKRIFLDDPEVLSGEVVATSGAPPEGPAYVIYTSGSTGRPKGAVNTHAAIVNRLLWMQATYALTGSDRVLQKTPTSFDVSVWELFWPLLTGARLVLARPGGHRDMAYLADVIAAEGVTTLHFVPSMLRLFLDVERVGERARSLRRVVASGEALSGELVETFFSRLSCELHNLYGPTEAAVDVTFWPCSRGGEERGVPIGRPIANTSIYLLDRRLLPVPIGAIGELYIGGIGLAQGYLGRPGLTAERFLPDPFGARAGSRLYRTGDLARYRADGAIEYLGRTDHQVKVRGVRIELGEIEVALRQHPEIRDAVVVALEDVPGEPRLVGYLVAVPDSQLLPDDVRSFLSVRLPAAMVPAVFAVLPSLPLTLSGKIDRLALPPVGPARGTRKGEREPLDPLEEMVAAVWVEVLRLERVGLHDDFFVLGGHSLLATQAVSRLRETLQVDLSLPDLFAAPTVARLAQKAAELLRDGASLRQPPILRIGRDGEVPLSFAQQRLWFLDQLEPGGTAYNVPAAVRLSGALDTSVLELSLDEIVLRHEILRTTFAAVDGRPVQVVSPHAHVRPRMVDLSGLPEAEREQSARRLAAEEADVPFDLARGPLLRVTLFRLGDDDHLLLVVIHHIVSDLWSMGLFVRELTALYGAFSRGESSPLPELSIQYADFANWQRQWLQGEVLDLQLRYWREQLVDASPLSTLPTDYPRPAAATHRGETIDFRISPTISAAVRELSRREGTTVFMTLLAAFQGLLHRRNDQEASSVGTPVAGRNRIETEDLIGFFVNMLVLRTNLAGDPDFPTLLARVRQVSLGAFAHQDLPFERLVEALQPERDLRRPPLFQVAFVLQNAPLGELNLGGLGVEPLDLGTGASLFDLTLRMREAGDILLGSLEYSPDLFEAGTIERLARHFQVLLAEAVADPERRLSELPLLSREEERELLGEAPRSFLAETPLHRLYEAQVRQRPGDVAVVFDGSSLTYADLDAQANRLGRHLRRLGVGPDTTVGLLLDRSLDLVVAILGVLKAGGAYVPIDPTYPLERIAFQLADSAARVVITRESLAVALPEIAVPVVCLDREAETLAACSAEVLPGGASAASLAYVIYTSGSTGRPKGVGVSHENVARLFLAAREWFDFGPQDVWTLFHSYAFDFSVWELWGALLYGGRLVVVPYQVSREPEAFHALLAEQRVTVLNQTPSAFRQLIRAEEEGASGALSLRFVVFGGEALEYGSLRAWVERHGDERPRLINMYGITETTVHVTYRRVLAAEVLGRSASEIGVPLPDLQLYVLDRHQRLQPVGVAGELCVGGGGLARGYLGRPELTAQRFVPNPFGREGGERLYRSGDLGRRLPGGGVEYLGRIDHQVKVRGFRIELGEIESALARHEVVRESVVVVLTAGTGEPRLVAYVTSGGESLTPGELRSFLADSLPEYMVPAVFVVLEKLPLTANGKVDRRALPAPEGDRPELAQSYEAPRTSAERTLAGIWAEILGIERVGVHDDFFDLGGHSLLATQVLSRVRGSFGVDLPLRALFERPTVAGLAEAVEQVMPSEEALDKLSDVLAALEMMSDEQVRAVLAEGGDEDP